MTYGARILVVLLSILMVGGAAVDTRFPGKDAAAGSPDEIVLIAPGANAGQIAEKYGLQVSTQFAGGVNGFAAEVPAGLLGRLETDPGVLSVEPNTSIQVSDFASPAGEPGVDPAALGAQVIPTGVRRIGALLNPIAKIDGKDDRVPVTVAVIDTGVDGTHPDLNVDVAHSADCSSGVSCVQGIAKDVYGHGTHVAGTIGALDNSQGVVGVAPGVTIWSIRVCNEKGTCPMSAILLAHQYVTEHASSIDVANLSITGGGGSAAWRAAIAENVRSGVVVVAAAGNESVDVYGSDGVLGTGHDQIPASFPEVMDVSALNDTDGYPGGFGPDSYAGKDDTMASFSDFAGSADKGIPVRSSGGAIDVAAPGVNILSTYRDGQYKEMSGTSMAAPHVSGAVALYIAAHGRAKSASDVYAIRQAVIGLSGPMQRWRSDGLSVSSDPDSNHEGLVLTQQLGSQLASRPVTPTPDVVPAPAPAPKGNVSLTSLFAPAKVTRGDFATIVATAVNQTGQTQVLRFVLTDTTTGATIITHQSTVNAGARVEVFMPWYTSGLRVGDHVIKATVSAPIDSNAADDVQSATVTVTPAQ